MALKLNEQLVYVRPDGVKYRLHAPPSRVVMSEEGFGTPPMQYVVDQAPFQHGNTVRDVFLQPRPVQLTVLQNFCSRSAYWDGRAALLDALRPNRVTDFDTPGKLLYYLANGEKRQLDVLLDAGPGFAPPQGGWREWSFTEVLRFTAHDPVWYDPAQQTLDFASGAELQFPITFPITFSSFGTVAEVAYDGTWLEYPTFVITGPIVSPRISNNTTGDIIQLNYSLALGNSITITLKGTKTIELNDGTNLLPYLSADSDLTTFSLAPAPTAPDGVNEIEVTGSGTAGVTAVQMRWYSRYFGI